MPDIDALQEPAVLEPPEVEPEPALRKLRKEKLRQEDFEDLKNHRDAVLWPEPD